MECAFFIFFLILFAHSAAADSSTSPSPSPTPTPFLRPSTFVVVAIGVSTTLFSLIFLLLLYAKHCKQASPTSSATADSATRKNSGVDRSVVESLPMFRYSSLRSSKIKGRRSCCLECAVCLGRFEGLEVLRLLPKCNHVFHVECVDTWLDAHSTCPLCRYRVDPEDVLLSTTTATHHQDPDPDIEAGKGIMFQLKRISGRHSSAGERGSAAVSSAAPSRRKDGQLLGCGGCGQTQSQSRLKLVARGLQQRWSDVEQSDLPYRRPPEVIMMNGNGSGRGVINSRSVSDMTGVNRFSGRESSNEIQRNGQGQGQGQGQMPSLSPTSTTTTAQPTHTVEP